MVRPAHWASARGGVERLRSVRVGEGVRLETEATLGRLSEGLFVVRRPGSEVVRPPLEDPHLSRRQLRLKVSPPDGILVQNVGRERVRVDGRDFWMAPRVGLAWDR